MKAEQIIEMIKAIGFLLLIFFAVKFLSTLENKVKTKDQHEKEIIKIDSSIRSIPFIYTDSQRANFLDNYQKFR